MSLSSTAQYYVTVDSQFRDQQKYPLDSNFGVSFSTKDPSLNYPQGLPIDQNQPYPRVSIDKNFDSIGIQVKGGKITEYVVDSVTGDIIFSGVTTPGDNSGNQIGRDFLILYNGYVLYSILYSIYHSSPFICRVSSTYVPKWLVMMKQKPTKTNTTLDSTFKLISNSSVYFGFDYNISSGLNISSTYRELDLINFEKYTYSNYVPFSNTNIVNIKVLDYDFKNYYTDYISTIEQTKAVFGVFAFDINGDPLQVNGHPWGYHQFAMNTSYYGQIFNMNPSNEEGRNVITVDKGDSLYCGVNVNTFDTRFNINGFSGASVVYPTYIASINSVKKPITYTRSSPVDLDQFIPYPNSVPSKVNTNDDNIIVYYLGYTGNSVSVGSYNNVGIIPININNPSFNVVPSTIENPDILTSTQFNKGLIMGENSVRDLIVVANTNVDVTTFRSTGSYYMLSPPSDNPFSVGTFTYGEMTGSGSTFSYTGYVNYLAHSYTGNSSVSIDYLSVVSTFITDAWFYLNKYVTTGPRDPFSKLGPAGINTLLIEEKLNSTYSTVIPQEGYNVVPNSAMCTMWLENNQPYVAYVLPGDNYSRYNIIVIKSYDGLSLNYAYDVIPTKDLNIIPFAKGTLFDVISFVVNTTVFIVVVSSYITYIYRRNYSSNSSKWVSTIIPNNVSYVIQKIKTVGSSKRIYLVGCNVELNTSNIYSIPLDVSSNYYYKIGDEFSFGENSNAIASLYDDSVVSFSKNGNNYKVYATNGFTLQNKVIDSQHTYYNNLFLDTIPTENLNSFKVINICSVIVDNITYVFSLRQDCSIDMYYMDSTNPIFMFNISDVSDFTKYNSENTFRAYYLNNKFIVLLGPTKNLFDAIGYPLIQYTITVSSTITYTKQEIDNGSSYNINDAWIYTVNNINYLTLNLYDKSGTQLSTFKTYTYNSSLIPQSPSSISLTYTVLCGDVYDYYIDQITGESMKTMLIVYAEHLSPNYRVKFGILSIPTMNVMSSVIIKDSHPSAVEQILFISFDRNYKLNTYSVVSIWWETYIYYLNLEDSSTPILLNKNLQASYQYGPPLKTIWNPSSNSIVTITYGNNNNTISIYDVTDINKILLLGQLQLNNIIAYYNYENPSDIYSPIYASLVSNKLIMMTSGRFSLHSSTSVAPIETSFLFYDITNPVFANQYQAPTEVSSNFNIYGNASSCIIKIQNDGQTLWNTSLGDSGNYSSTLDSQYVNINTLTLDTTELNVFANANWMTKLSVIDPSSSSPTQLITNPFNSYNAKNASMLKLRSDLGTSTYLIPIVGGNDTKIIGCGLINTLNSYSCGISSKSSITYIYQKQNASTLTNPIIIQNVLNTLSLENSHVTSFNTDGTLLWSSSIQSENDNASVSLHSHYSYSGDSFIVCKSNEDCFVSDSTKSVKQSIIQFPETNTKDYIIVCRFSNNGIYKESNNIETPSSMIIDPDTLYSNGNYFTLTAITEEKNLNFANLLLRNKDGSLGSIETLIENNLYFTKTMYTGGINLYNTPTGCIGSVVKLWGAGGERGNVSDGQIPGQGGGGSFSQTFIDPSYTGIYISVGKATRGGGIQKFGTTIEGYTGYGGRGGDGTFVAVPQSTGYLIYAIAAGGGGGGFYFYNGGPGGNNVNTNGFYNGGYGKNGVGGSITTFSVETGGYKGENSKLVIYSLTGGLGFGGTGADGCGGGGNGFGGGAGGSYTISLFGPSPNIYPGGAGGGTYGDIVITSNNYLPANLNDTDYPLAGNSVGYGGYGTNKTGGNGYAVVYSFFYSSTGYTKGESPANYNINPTYIDSTIINYKFDSSYSDTNGNTYSKITCYTSSGSTGYAFTPYHTTDTFTFSTGSTGTSLIGKYIYIKGDPVDTILNNNFNIRDSYYNSTTNEYTIILNSKIDTSQIIRSFQEVNNSSLSKYFYTSNITQSLTTTITSFTTGSNPNTIVIPNTYNFNTSTKYYIITPYNKITNITNIQSTGSYYILTVDTPSNLSGNTYITITPFNDSALYTLQFYPGSLATPLYYKVSLQRLILPNRRVRNSPYSGVRELSDFPYIFLEIYNANDTESYDNQIVNTFYSNDPNKDGRAIFTIPITSAGGQTNYLFLSGSGSPKIKFTPGYYNIRIRLKDPYGNLIEFDNTPYKTSDSAFTGAVVDPRLMNVVVDLTFTPF